MTPREDLRRAIENYLARRHPGTRWNVGLRGDQPAQASPVDGRLVSGHDGETLLPRAPAGGDWAAGEEVNQ